MIRRKYVNCAQTCKMCRKHLGWKMEDVLECRRRTKYVVQTYRICRKHIGCLKDTQDV